MRAFLADFSVTAWPGVLVVVISLCACEIGFRAGRRIKATVEDVTRAEIMTIQSAALALLALLLSFGFSMGASALSNRKQVVLSEAAVIGRAHQATRLLDEPMGGEIRSLLLDYIDTRLDLYHGRLLDEAAVNGKLRESERLSAEIWTLSAGLARERPQSIPIGFLLNAVSDLNQLNPRRVASLTGTVPPAMLYALILASMIALGWVGCGIGLGPRRSVAIPLILALLFGAIVAMISDLNQPRHGIVLVSQRALTDLKASLGEPRRK